MGQGVQVTYFSFVVNFSPEFPTFWSTLRFCSIFLRQFLVLQETYPSTPPVWFSESEDANVSNALTSLADTSGLDNHLLYQVKLLLRQLCTLFGLPTPKFDTDTCSSPSEAATASSSLASRGGATGSLGEASCSSSSGAVSVNDAKDEETSEEESEDEEEEEMEDGEEDEDDEEIPLDMEDPVAEAASKKARQDDEIHSEHIQVEIFLKADGLICCVW